MPEISEQTSRMSKNSWICHERRQGYQSLSCTITTRAVPWRQPFHEHGQKDSSHTCVYNSYSNAALTVRDKSNRPSVAEVFSRRQISLTVPYSWRMRSQASWPLSSINSRSSLSVHPNGPLPATLSIRRFSWTIPEQHHLQREVKTKAPVYWTIYILHATSSHKIYWIYTSMG